LCVIQEQSELSTRTTNRPSEYAADSIDNYAILAKTAFPATMPRDPNASLAPSFEATIGLVTGGLRHAIHLPSP